MLPAAMVVNKRDLARERCVGVERVPGPEPDNRAEAALLDLRRLAG